MTGSGITIRTNKWKLLYHREKHSPHLSIDPLKLYDLSIDPLELYDLNADPDEKNNLIKKKPKIALRLMNQLFDFLAEKRLKDKTSEKVPIKDAIFKN